jgi:hypothetical protein
LLPSLVIGVSEDVFWKQTPKTLQLYVEAYNQRREAEDKRMLQMLWKMGDYIRVAMSSIVVPVGFIDSINNLQKYPECPFNKDENNANEMSEQQIQNERLRCYMFFKAFGKHK